MSKKYLTVYNLSREKDWILKNAFDIIETREINTVWQLDFSIPMNDQDQQHCQPYWYVRYGDDGQLYRFTEQVKTNADKATVTYHCEHVIATLSDDIMFQGPYMIGNVGTYTNQVLNFILNKQTVKNWILGTCEPRRQFEYSWENENLLAALFSVPNCFATPYMWTYDTSSFPWKVNLVEIHEDADPDFYLMAKKNILRSEESSSNLEICTRLYGLGEGEGVNQLTIKSVNNGLPYIQSSPEKIAEYGIVSRIFVDRRYQYPETLKARMETLLHELETPSLKREFDIVDLHDMSPDDMYKAEVGRICLLKDDNTKVYITKTVKNWTVPGDMKITIATKATDISTSIADLADRQRIEQVYSQGASQVYSFSFAGNATDQYPLNGYVYFPDDLKYLNEVKLKVKLDSFRSYSKASSKNNGAVTNQSTTTNGSVSNKETTESGKVTDAATEISGKVVNADTEESGKVVNKDTEEGGKVVNADSEEGGKVVNAESEEGGKVVNAESEEGGKVINADSEEGGKVVNADSEEGGKVVNVDTTEGGKVDTATGEGGGGSGTTGMSSGGGGISLSDVTVNVDVTVKQTEDAYWDNQSDIMSSKTKVGNDGGLIAIETGSKHKHSVIGYTGEVTPPASANYKHNHAINFQTGNDNNEGEHTHTVYEESWTQGHSHSLSRSNLRHYHPVSASATGSISVNNQEGGGQTGFQHSHNFSLAAHTHPINLEAHKHKINLDGHTHKINLDGHTHKINLDGHTHKINLDGHTHKINLDGHTHKINLDGHTHKINLDGHTHKINLDGHTHKFNLDGHSHKFSLDPHSHDIEPGIFISGNPTQADLFINGTKKTTITAASTELDITEYLKRDGKVPRGEWIEIRIKPTNAAPNNMAYISVFGNVFAYIQSYTGGNF